MSVLFFAIAGSYLMSNFYDLLVFFMRAMTAIVTEDATGSFPPEVIDAK